MRPIDADILIEAMAGACKIYDAHGIDTTVARSLITIAEKAPTVDGLIKCKDCKHCGVKNGATPFDIVWPDGVCPCRSDDPYYSWIPDGDWYCANGERR